MKVSALLTVLFLAQSSVVLSSEEEMKEPLFLSLTRQEAPLGRMPSNVSVISKEEIETSGAKTLDEILDLAPSVDLNKTGSLGTFTTLRMRGVPSSSHVQVLVDDQPLGGVSIQFFDISQISADLIERVEIVRGGSSVLYGANTIGGVVNVITKRHKKEQAHSSLSLQTRSFPTIHGDSLHTYQSQAYSADLGVTGGGFDGYLNTSRYETDGYQENETADNISFFGKGGYTFENGARIQLALSRSDHEVGVPQGTTVPISEWDGQKERKGNKPASFEQAERDLNMGRLTATFPLGEHILMESQFHGSDQDYLLTQISNNSTTADIETRIVGNETKFILPAGITVGTSYLRDLRISKGDPSVHVTNWGVYVQQSINTESLDLIPALRLDQHGTFGNIWNPRFTAVYRMTGRMKVSGNVSRSFRAPTLSNLFVDYPDTLQVVGDYSFYGNPNLRPETAWTYDLGTEFKVSERSVLGVTGYYTRIRERITSAQTRGNFNIFGNPINDTNINAPRAELSGVEVDVHGTFGPFEYRGNYTYQRAKGNSNDASQYVPLRLTPRHLANGQLTWSVGSWSLSNILQYVHKQYQSDNEQGVQLPGYFLWDGRISKRILGADIYFAADNILDKKYAESFGFGTVNPQPGRTFWSGITLHFID